MGGRGCLCRIRGIKRRNPTIARNVLISVSAHRKSGQPPPSEARSPLAHKRSPLHYPGRERCGIRVHGGIRTPHRVGTRSRWLFLISSRAFAWINGLLASHPAETPVVMNGLETGVRVSVVRGIKIFREGCTGDHYTAIFWSPLLPNGYEDDYLELVYTAEPSGPFTLLATTREGGGRPCGGGGFVLLSVTPDNLGATLVPLRQNITRRVKRVEEGNGNVASRDCSMR
ncbi:hypothetical protein BT96DRAFT_950836 [Gymnopus androsaceus JB14]|uniref:Uncharacterized protein n=1 Tax=Gymnopus androsaceus JB14 TaxID=1447944 RepID=A0A6A4GEX5_9AGAR|nr:hypothetical protein BT96DRAFT_950836 [Gymnopus androsaceus JB14]